MSESSLSGLLVGLGIFAIFLVLIVIAVLVVFVIGRWKLFVKAGKGGWEAIIPFYSDYVLCEIAGLEWYWFLALIATSIVSVLSTVSSAIVSLEYIAYIVVIFANVSVFYNLSKKFHKDTAFIVLGTIFSGIMICVAGFSKDYFYDKDVVVDKNGIIAAMTNKNNNVNQTGAQPVQQPVNPSVDNQQNVDNNQNNTTM